MFKKMSEPGVPFPINKEGAVKYAEELREGIKIWTKICMLVIPAAILFYVFNFIRIDILGIIILFVLGCPTIMILGFSVGCLRFLTPKECWKIILQK